MFPSKIILFGEYATLVGAPALALPLTQYSAKWSRAADARATSSRNALWQVFLYLEHLKTQKKLLADLDFTAFSAALNAGFWIESNIPNGYGLGSSGAVVAAVYNEFCAAPVTDLVALKKILAQMEAHFHGTSSGIDPLISFVKKPILIENSEKMQQISVSNDVLQQIFLIDTQKNRNTQHFVEIFKEKIKNDAAFAKICANELKTQTENCISAVLNHNPNDLQTAIALLSQIQYDNFGEMIPDTMRTFWQEGLKNDAYKIKLCGAGGGGFFMGFTHDFDALPDDLKNIAQRII
jgi:mevalonate kinase